MQVQKLFKIFIVLLQTVDVLADHPEKRTPIAMEILSSEVQYYRSLKAINDVYVKPLKAALSSSRWVNIIILNWVFEDLLSYFHVYLSYLSMMMNVNKNVNCNVIQFTCMAYGCRLFGDIIHGSP